MNVRQLIPWGRNGDRAPAPYREPSASPFLTLHREIDRLFDEALHGFGAPSLLRGAAGWGPGAWPSLEVSETDAEVRVTAEVPGIDEKDVEVLFSDGTLTIRGEKKAEIGGDDPRFSERYYGRFEREIAVGADVDEEKVKASFKNGVLTVTLPRRPEARAKAKRIPIDARH